MHPQLQPQSAPVDQFSDLPAPTVPFADHALLHEILETTERREQLPNLYAILAADLVRAQSARNAPAIAWPNADVRARLDAVRASLVPRRLPAPSVAPVTYADVFAELAQSTRRRILCSMCGCDDCFYSHWSDW